MSRIVGIDFSGAKDAGRKIWIAEGHATGSGTYTLERVLPATELSQGVAEPESAIPALTRYIAGLGDARVGCDFPFGLPRPLVDDKHWSAFALNYTRRFPNPSAFRVRMLQSTLRRELKRKTDRIAKTPFNSYNLRLYRQTWWGIAGVLAPLVADNAASVLPQQRAYSGRPWVIEVCAACTLKSIGLYPTYKGTARQALLARRSILDMLIARKFLRAPSNTVRRLLLENAGGDALDAVIGAIAALHADLPGSPDEFERLEGRVYFEV